jgi:hypothetical protein
MAFIAHSNSNSFLLEMMQDYTTDPAIIYRPQKSRNYLSKSQCIEYRILYAFVSSEQPYQTHMKGGL